MASNSLRQKAEGAPVYVAEDPAGNAEEVREALNDAGVELPQRKKQLFGKFGLALILGMVMALLAASGGAYYLLGERAPEGEQIMSENYSGVGGNGRETVNQESDTTDGGGD